MDDVVDGRGRCPRGFGAEYVERRARGRGLLDDGIRVFHFGPAGQDERPSRGSPGAWRSFHRGRIPGDRDRHRLEPRHAPVDNVLLQGARPRGPDLDGPSLPGYDWVKALARV